MRIVSTVGGAAILIGAAVIACSSFEGDDGSKPAVDAGPGQCPTVFVSSQGDDAKDGCNAATPVKTIARAIARAKEAGGQEVHVCTGSYDERALVLDAPISLRGGYDCTSWERSKQETSITRGETSTGLATLVISSVAVTRTVEVDGFRIQGPNGGSAGAAVRITDRAMPYLHDLDVTGGSGDAAKPDPGAIGIDIQGGAAPEIASSTISGGLGKGSVNVEGELGSSAIRVASSAPKLHDLTINGGTSKSPQNGMMVSAGSNLTGENAIAHVTITIANADSIASGLDVSGADSKVDLVDSSIEIDEMQCTTTRTGGCKAQGFFSRDATVKVLRNRVIAPEIPNAAKESGVAAIVGLGGSIDVENNLVFGGNEKNNLELAAVGVSLINLANGRVVYNTIAVGPGGKAKAYGLFIIASDSPVVDGNVIASRSGTALLFDHCKHTMGSFWGNVVIGQSNVLNSIHCKDDLTGDKNLVVTSAVEAELGKAGSNNARISSFCTGDSACKPATAPGCSTNMECAFGVFQDGATRASLKTYGWTPRPSIPCSIATPLFAESDNEKRVTVDQTGTPRSSPFTIGAIETEVCGK